MTTDNTYDHTVDYSSLPKASMAHADQISRQIDDLSKKADTNQRTKNINDLRFLLMRMISRAKDEGKGVCLSVEGDYCEHMLKKIDARLKAARVTIY